MKNIKFKLAICILFIGIFTANAQKFEKDFTKEISYTDKEVLLNANYADIEIKEWNKKKIKIEATMIVEGVSKEIAQSYFDSWKIDIENNDEIRIISTSKNHFPTFINLDTNFDFDFNFEPMVFEMPEISIESLGVLDSIDFSFPELNFENFDFHFDGDFFISIDSLHSGNSAIYIQKWREKNKENFEELRVKSREMAKKYQEAFKLRSASSEKRKELIEKLRQVRMESRDKAKEMRKKMHKNREKELKKLKESRAKIREILKNRDKAKVRTKLIIRVPKGTDINMNIKYSKISTN